MPHFKRYLHAEIREMPRCVYVCAHMAWYTGVLYTSHLGTGFCRICFMVQRCLWDWVGVARRERTRVTTGTKPYIHVANSPRYDTDDCKCSRPLFPPNSDPIGSKPNRTRIMALAYAVR